MGYKLRIISTNKQEKKQASTNWGTLTKTDRRAKLLNTLLRGSLDRIACWDRGLWTMIPVRESSCLEREIWLSGSRMGYLSECNNKPMFYSQLWGWARNRLWVQKSRAIMFLRIIDSSSTRLHGIIAVWSYLCGRSVCPDGVSNCSSLWNSRLWCWTLTRRALSHTRRDERDTGDRQTLIEILITMTEN